jgi:hypothetical protein
MLIGYTGFVVAGDGLNNCKTGAYTHHLREGAGMRRHRVVENAFRAWRNVKERRRR